MAERDIVVYEVGPRDGCRTKRPPSAPQTRSRSSIALERGGLPVIEVSAFVSPKWVPQMADAAEVFAGITRRPARGTRRWCRTCRARARDRRPA